MGLTLRKGVQKSAEEIGIKGDEQKDTAFAVYNLGANTK
jgi:hypothetical protein